MCEIIIITIYIGGIYISNDYYTGRPEDTDAGASANGHDCRKVGGPVITGRESSIGQVQYCIGTHHELEWNVVCVQLGICKTYKNCFLISYNFKLL